MSHMEPEITDKCDWLEVDSTSWGTYWVLAEYAPAWPIPADVEVPGKFIHPDILSAIVEHTEIPGGDGDYAPHVDYITLRRGYGARFSAPGYLDCTEWCVFKTLREAKDYLKEQEDE